MGNIKFSAAFRPLFALWTNETNSREANEGISGLFGLRLEICLAQRVRNALPYPIRPDIQKSMYTIAADAWESGRELYSNVIAHRKAFIEQQSHSDFPNFPDIQKGRCSMKTREQVALDVLDDNPWQPRQSIATNELQELADNIHQLGRRLQVPLVRPVQNGRYELAFGHRRVAACRLLFEQEK